MKTQIVRALAAIVLAAVILPAAEVSPLRQTGVIPLPGVEGRIDHLGVDVHGQRLFVSALGNHTLEVLDLRQGIRLTSIRGLHEPQGVYYVPEVNKLYVASSQDGTCKVFDGSSYQFLRTLSYSGDADNVRYDAAAGRIYVGYGEGGLGAIDIHTGEKVADVALPAHPESFRLETSGPRIFVNLPAAHHTIAVVDRARSSIAATWSVNAEANFPMALDEASHCLLIVTRQPAQLIAIDTQTGKAVASVPAVGDADDLFFDAAHRRAYVSGGAGFLDVFAQRDGSHYQRLVQIPTAAGARTSLFVPELNRLYLAVPHRGNQRAEIRIFEAGP